MLPHMIAQHPDANVPMNTYTILPHSDGSGWDVHVIGYDGARQSMLDFATEGSAEAWIASDKMRDRAEGKPG